MINLKNVKLSNKQKIYFSKLSKKDQLEYLMSFLGIKKRMSIDRMTRERVSSTALPRVYGKNELMNFWHHKNRDLYNTSRDKTPENDSSNQWFGVEIECYLPKSNFDESYGDCDGTCREDCTCHDCSECGQHDENRDCECECTDDCGGLGGDYIQSVRDALEKLNVKRCQVVSDGSLHDTNNEFGVEIKVLFHLDDTKSLEKVCQFLSDNDASVDTSCGLHVHIDHRELKTREEKELVAMKYDKAMSILRLMLPESRRNNRYCADGYSFRERYHKVNACSLDKHGTIEIRAHSGTVNYEKIISWVRILSYVKNSAAFEIHDSASNLSPILFCNDLQLPGELKYYVYKRIELFNPSVTTQESLENETNFESSEDISA